MRKFDWTEDRTERLKRALTGGETQHDAARALGCSRVTVRSKALALAQDGFSFEPPQVGVRVRHSMHPVALAKLESAIIKPGFEKHLEPLLYYRGNQSLGRVHRLWNFTASMMLQGCETVADATQRLSMNDQFSHLCEPDKPVTNMSLASFWSRVLDTPKVHGEDPQLIEFIRSMKFMRFELTKLPVITHDRRVRWTGPGGYRVYKSAKRPEGSGPRDALSYPFMIHDGGKPEHELLRLVTAAVPSGLMGDLRADICQDLIVGILCGDFNKDDLLLPKREVMKRVRKMFPEKYSHVSLDAVIPGTDGLRLLDTI